MHFPPLLFNINRMDVRAVVIVASNIKDFQAIVIKIIATENKQHKVKKTKLLRKNF